jgi:hypothetical protein
VTRYFRFMFILPKQLMLTMPRPGIRVSNASFGVRPISRCRYVPSGHKIAAIVPYITTMPSDSVAKGSGGPR